MATTRSERKYWSLGRFAQGFVQYDWWLVLATAILIVVGGMSLFSIDHSAIENNSGDSTNHFARQLLRLAIGIIPFSFMLFVKTSAWRKFSVLWYIANLGILLLVLLAGKTGGGAQRWLQIGPIDFQPSELAKLVLVLTLSSFYANRMEHIRKLSTFALGFLHVAVPMALIYKQPHLGATLVVLAVWLTISLIAGVPIHYVVVAIGLGILALVAAYKIPGVLDQFQLDRIDGLLNPNGKSSYQTRTAAIAFGSGGFSGTGYLKGEQKAGAYVPEQETDFIFTVIGEEGGFIGCMLVLATFGLLFGRLWWILFTSRSKYSQMLVAGSLAIFTFHTFANLGMILSLLPVVGLWLPFISYGGTALWLCMALVGLCLNVKRSEDEGEMFTTQRF